MKRFLSLVLSLAMLFSVLPNAVFAAKDGDLVFSEGFEDGAPKWKVSSGGETLFTLNNQYYTEGKSSVKVRIDNGLDSSPAFMQKDKVSLEPGADYTFVMDIATTSGTVVTPYIRLFDANDKRTTSLGVKYNQQAGWQQVAYNFQATAEVVSFEIYLSAVKNVTGEAYIDNIRVYKGKTAPKTDVSKVPAPTASAPATSTAPAANAVKPIAKEISTLLYDDFEKASLEGWEFMANSEDYVKLSKDKVNSGTQALRVEDAFTDNIVGLKSQMFPVTPGVLYTISGEVYNDGSTGASPYINFFNADKKKVGSKGASAKADAWKTVKETVVAPAEAAYIQVLVTGGMAAVGTSYIDWIKLEEGGKLPEVTDKQTATANVPATANDGDLIFSDDFENGLGYWKTLSSVSSECFETSEEYYTSGSKSLKASLKEASDINHGLSTTRYPLEPNSTYTFVIDSFCMGAPVTPMVRLFTAENVRTTTITIPLKTKGWNQTVHTFTTDSAIAKFEIYLYCAVGTYGDAYLDNLRIYKGKVDPKDDLSGKKAPEVKEIDFIFKSPYDMPEFKPTIGHPRVYFNKDDIETIKANASHPQNASAYERLQKEISSTSDGKLKTLSGDNLDDKLMGIIQAKAFYYAVWGDEAKGREAVSMLHNFLDDANPQGSEYNSQGYLVFTIAAVYDWCYPLLTADDMKRFQNKAMETGSTMESGFPPSKGSVLNGHSAEAMILRDQMALAIAVYDERPDIYQAIAGRYFSQSVPSVKWLAQAKSSPFGNSYVTYRYQWEVISAFMMDALGIPNIFGEDHKYVMQWLLYARRPDGSSIRDGDSVSNNQTLGMYDERGTRTFFLAGNYYKDPYLKGEALRHNNGLFVEENSGSNTLSSIEVLCFNDPSVEYKSVKELPLSMYYPAPRGEMIARTSWAEGINAPSVVAQMKVDEYWTQGHDHLDSGEFEIYYKGALANDTGYYQAGRVGSNKENSGNTVFGTVHFYNYHRRTIAHNCMLVYDPNEDVKTSYKNYSNDGGQIYANNESSLYSVHDVSEERSHVANVLGQEFGPDTVQPDYTYLKGDLAKAYGDKVPEYERSFMFLNLKNSDTPAAMVVFDRIIAKDKTFDKKWVLHGLEKPEINGSRTVFKDTREGYNGKMTVDTLLPKADNLKIETVGKEDWVYTAPDGKSKYPSQAFEVDGVDYWAQTLEGKYNEGGGYRIEASPKADSEKDYFLNVIQVADANSTHEPLASEMIEGTTHTGVKIADRVVMFGNEKDRISGNVNFTVAGDGWFKYTVADLKEGTWKVVKDGADLCEIVATKDGGVGSFEAGAGAYTLSYLGAYGEKMFTTTPQPYTEGINLKLEPANKYIYSDVDPFTVNGRTLVPMRAIFEALDANVTWDEATATATGEKDGIVIKITENKDIAYVNGAEYKLDAPAMIKDGRFVVPVRFVAESFGVLVSWDDFSKTVIIRTSGAASINGNEFTGRFGGKFEGFPNGLPVYKLIQSADNGTGQTIANAFDGILGTMWGVQADEKGNPGYAIIDLGSSKTIDSIAVSFMKGNQRVYTFSIYTSEDGVNYTLVKEKLNSAGTSEGLETFDLGGVKGRYVKYVGYGNSVNAWNSINEIVISGK